MVGGNQYLVIRSTLGAIGDESKGMPFIADNEMALRCNLGGNAESSVPYTMG